MGLGDRIAVLNKGKVQQVGTPWEIYHYPASTFVATFVGSPPMNLIERGDTLVGFRPEHFLPEDLVGERGGRVPLHFQVERVEYLGSDRFVYGSVRGVSGDHRVIARLPFTVTDEVVERASNRFAVAADHLHTYSKESGERIEATPPVDVGAASRSQEPGS
jgi:ABC-type sugar transport system ATPase subunit